MSRDDDKQIQDALLAIKKLVEMSGDKMGMSDDVLTLDNVVWRNPVKDEAEHTPQSDQNSSEELAVGTPATAEMSLSKPSEPKASEQKASEQKAPEPNVAVTQARISVSSRDLDMPQRHDVIAPPLTSPLAREEKAPEGGAIIQPAPQVQAVPEIAQEVTELTSPLGRRGGGFYSAMTPKPAIKTLAEQMVSDRLPTTPPQQAAAPMAAAAPAPLAHEPALTDFHGADFNFSAAEGLMTAASFAELDHAKTPVTAEVQVPLAEPAVSDPVRDVQAMFQEPEYEAPEHEAHQHEGADLAYSAHPNLTVVSDQTQEADDEEEGFSGAVRLALRSIIKEQVSTWLQGNMTGLIEEALTTPQKRPTSSSKPTSKKR